MADVGYECVMHIHGRKFHIYGRAFHIHGKHSKNHVSAFFCILGQFRSRMDIFEWQDFKTHVKKQNPTSRTERRRKSLKYLF